MENQADNLLSKIGNGIMTVSPYDMAWVGRLNGDLDAQHLSTPAINWLKENQLPDGSWGNSEFFHFHDRVVCTLSGLAALQVSGKQENAQQIEKAVGFLERNGEGISTNPVGATVGFELIAPTLVSELSGSTTVTVHESNARKKKLARIPAINKHVPVAHSAEMVGKDSQHLLDWGNLQELNGSIGYSPAATAYYINNVDDEERKKEALGYLSAMMNNNNGNLPNVGPIDVFEVAWVLWNLELAFSPNQYKEQWDGHLDFLESSWTYGQGTAFAKGYTPKDGDDTSLVFEVLRRGGRRPDLEAVLHFEDNHVFKCFEIESDPSTSTNIHVIGALRQGGLAPTSPSVQKALKFLKTTQNPDGSLLDKWHISPYYPTSHFIIASAGYCDTQATQKAVQWIVASQNKNGSWGYILPTAEETAYAIQALVIARRYGYKVPEIAVKNGRIWLMDHMDEVAIPLWIGKCLYSPIYVVKSTILSALKLSA